MDGLLKWVPSWVQVLVNGKSWPRELILRRIPNLCLGSAERRAVMVEWFCHGLEREPKGY